MRSIQPLTSYNTAMRYRLRTLLMLLAIGPPIVAWYVWPRVHEAYAAWQWREAVRKAKPVLIQAGVVPVAQASVWRLIDVKVKLARLQGELADLEAQIAALQRAEVAAHYRSAKLREETDLLRDQLNELRVEYAERQRVAARLSKELARLQPASIAESETRLSLMNRENANPPGALRFSPGIERAMLHEATQRK